MLYCELSFFDGQQRCHGCITARQALAQAQQDRLRQHLTDEAATTPDLAAPPPPTVSSFAERLHDLHARLNDAQERTTSDMHQIIADLAPRRARCPRTAYRYFHNGLAPSRHPPWWPASA